MRDKFISSCLEMDICTPPPDSILVFSWTCVIHLENVSDLHIDSASTKMYVVRTPNETVLVAEEMPTLGAAHRVVAYCNLPYHSGLAMKMRTL